METIEEARAREPDVGRSRIPATALLFLAILTLQIFRTWPATVLPVLAVEDGTRMLAPFFNDGDARGIFRVHNRYVSVVPNAVAWLGTRLPVTLAPHAFTLAALLFSTLGYVLLSRPTHEWLVAKARSRTVVVLVLAVLPLGKGLLVDNLTYSQWSLLFLVFVLLSRSALPVAGRSLLGWSVAVALCAMSHPLSVLALPICAYHFLASRRRDQRLFVVAVGAVLVAYQIWGVQVPKRSPPSLDSLSRALETFLARVSFESVFGPRLTSTLVTGGRVELALAGGAAVSAIVLFLALRAQRSARRRVALVSMLPMAFAVLAVTTHFRAAASIQATSILGSPQAQRYVFVPKLIFALLLLSCLVPRVERALGRIRSRPAKAFLLALCVTPVLAVERDNRFLYRESAEEGRRVRAFLAVVNEEVGKAGRGEPHRRRLILERGGKWDIVLEVPD